MQLVVKKMKSHLQIAEIKLERVSQLINGTYDTYIERLNLRIKTPSVRLY